MAGSSADLQGAGGGGRRQGEEGVAHSSTLMQGQRLVGKLGRSRCWATAPRTTHDSIAHGPQAPAAPDLHLHEGGLVVLALGACHCRQAGTGEGGLRAGPLHC